MLLLLLTVPLTKPIISIVPALPLSSLSSRSFRLFCLFSGRTGVACVQTSYLETPRRTLGDQTLQPGAVRRACRAAEPECRRRASESVGERRKTDRPPLRVRHSRSQTVM